MFKTIRNIEKINKLNKRNVELAREVRNLNRENLAVHNENKDLRFENEEQKELIERISKLVSCNKYNNEKAILDKIKELVNDYQSNN